MLLRKSIFFYFQYLFVCCTVFALSWADLQAQNDSLVTMTDSLFVRNHKNNLFRFSYDPANAVSHDSIVVELNEATPFLSYAVNARLDSVFSGWFPDGEPIQTMKRMAGYRIIVYRGTSHKQAVKAREVVYKNYGDWRSYLSFKSPNYIVKTGDFTDKKLAESARKKLKKRFDDPSLVPDRITIWFATYANPWK